jgi:putative sigma-54 modulation protein
MKIDVRFRSLEPAGSFRDHVVRRLHAHLSRFGNEIRSVVVRLSDINGDRGGVDMRCQITVRGARIAAVVAEDISADAYAAVELAATRVSHAVGRNLERARTLRAQPAGSRRAS